VTGQPSWRSIANQLAARLFWADADHCAGGSMSSGPGHTRKQADPECPFCADRAAYDAWKAKVQESRKVVTR
jgi:hypothetical protein